MQVPVPQTCDRPMFITRATRPSDPGEDRARWIRLPKPHKGSIPTTCTTTDAAILSGFRILKLLKHWLELTRMMLERYTLGELLVYSRMSASLALGTWMAISTKAMSTSSAEILFGHEYALRRPTALRFEQVPQIYHNTGLAPSLSQRQTSSLHRLRHVTRARSGL